jgi:8-oxo-dGTP pyrophosphatase MutT (NUDIX family)
VTDAMHDRVIRIVAAVIVDSRDRLLLVRKRGTTAFMQPGGKIDPGESAVEALRRELVEELGVHITDADVRDLGRHGAPAANEPGHVVDAQLFMVDVHTEPHPAAEIDEMVWIDPAAPGDIELAPLTEDTVLALFSSRQG